MARLAASRRYNLLFGTIIGLALLVFWVGPALAVSISRGYSTADKDLKVNMIVSLAQDNGEGKQSVERSSPSNKSKVVGIVTTIDASLLTLANSESGVYVTTSGDGQAYVSDLNGDIKQGDFIVVSPITGIGMKASDTDTQVVGTALENFNKDTASSQKVTTKQGSDKTILVNTVRLNVDPRDRGNAKQKPYLVLFGQSITGKTVTQVQVIVALVIFFLLLVVEGSIIYGAIHSSIISVGRNPLARKALFRQLLQVSWLAFVVLLFGLGSIYVILWI